MNQTILKEKINYDPITGIFKWIIKPSKRIKIGSVAGNSTSRYHKIEIDNVQYLSHRLAWLYVYGYFPINNIDHINHNPFDNRIENLREATTQENNKNRSKNKNNTSGFNGVYWDKSRNKWVVLININGKSKNLGRFDTVEEAINIRILANEQYNFHKNHGEIVNENN